MGSTSIENLIKDSTVFQWNARGLQTHMSDFRQFTYQHNFPIIVICEPGLPKNFRLSGYDTFKSLRSNGPSRVMLAMRKDLTYINHYVPEHASNEYAFATVKNGPHIISVIAACISPRAKFDEVQFEGVLKTCTSPYVISGDFNAHHPLWGGSHINHRGEKLADCLNLHHLNILNDGCPTYLRGTTYSSCLDLTFVSRELLPYTTWFSDIETRGSDHIPTYTTIK